MRGERTFPRESAFHPEELLLQSSGDGAPVIATWSPWHLIGTQLLACCAESLEFPGESGSSYWNQRANWRHMAPNPASFKENDKTPQGANQM